jgi:predicted nucleic acid-binding protein
MIVVSDSSVLIALGAIGKLGILPKKFGVVHLPPAVWL